MTTDGHRSTRFRRPPEGVPHLLTRALPPRIASPDRDAGIQQVCNRLLADLEARGCPLTQAQTVTAFTHTVAQWRGAPIILLPDGPSTEDMLPASLFFLTLELQSGVLAIVYRAGLPDVLRERGILHTLAHFLLLWDAALLTELTGLDPQPLERLWSQCPLLALPSAESDAPAEPKELALPVRGTPTRTLDDLNRMSCTVVNRRRRPAASVAKSETQQLADLPAVCAQCGAKSSLLPPAQDPRHLSAHVALSTDPATRAWESYALALTARFERLLTARRRGPNTIAQP